MTNQRGTSLAELLVVLALIGIMVVAAAQIITHSIRLLGATGRALSNPMMVHVNERIRRDIQEAAGLMAVEMVWSRDPLDIRTRSGGIVVYSVVNGNLVREVFSGAGEATDERVVLRGVTSWWWRSTAPSVVDVNIGHLVYLPPEYHASRKVGYETERQIENLRFAARGGWGGAQW